MFCPPNWDREDSNRLGNRSPATRLWRDRCRRQHGPCRVASIGGRVLLASGGSAASAAMYSVSRVDAIKAMRSTKSIDRAARCCAKMPGLIHGCSMARWGTSAQLKHVSDRRYPQHQDNVRDLQLDGPRMRLCGLCVHNNRAQSEPLFLCVYNNRSNCSARVNYAGNANQKERVVIQQGRFGVIRRLSRSSAVQPKYEMHA